VQPGAPVETPAIPGTPTPAVDPVDASFALREALLTAAEGAVAQGSAVDGFAADRDLRLPLPGKLEASRETLVRFGLGREVDALDLALSRAAEATAADALPALNEAIRDLPLADPLATLRAGGHAATDELRSAAAATLTERLEPIAAGTLTPAGVTTAFDRLGRRGGALVAQAGVAGSDLAGHAAAGTVDGLLTLMAAGESAIRTDPAARTTPLLARVFVSPAGESVARTPVPSPAGDRGGDANRALREALVLGVQRAVERAGQVDGYYDNPSIRIPLPKTVARLGGSLRDIGLGKVVDDFELSLNRAAEKAAVEATPILIDAVMSVNLGDAVTLLRGGDTAATDLLRSKTEVELMGLFKPIITEKMEEAGVTRTYNKVVEQAGPLMALLGGGEEPDLPSYVTGKAMDGLFSLVAEEEKRIRKDPAARASDLLRRIFGSLGLVPNSSHTTSTKARASSQA
jgi:hypothetical protein